jgi:hypothetical protein
MKRGIQRKECHNVLFFEPGSHFLFVAGLSLKRKPFSGDRRPRVRQESDLRFKLFLHGSAYLSHNGWYPTISTTVSAGFWRVPKRIPRIIAPGCHPLAVSKRDNNLIDEVAFVESNYQLLEYKPYIACCRCAKTNPKFLWRSYALPAIKVIHSPRALCVKSRFGF